MQDFFTVICGTAKIRIVHAKTREIEDASHFLQEDAPERIVQWIETFMQANP